MSVARERPKAISLTDAAAERVRSLLGQRGSPSAGVRVGVATKGCSGLSYKIDYVDRIDPSDEVVQDRGVTIFIDPKALMFILGTEMDYVVDKFHEGFVFNNPLEKGRCGCGESFHV